MNIPNSDYVLAELGIFMCGRKRDSTNSAYEKVRIYVTRWKDEIECDIDVKTYSQTPLEPINYKNAENHKKDSHQDAASVGGD
jgi:hypothetical protein